VASETSALATVELQHPRQTLRRRLSDEQQRWFADLYRRNASAVHSVCKSVLRNRDDAADATQEVFLRAVDSLKEASSVENARSWLLTVARSYCLDALQRRQHSDRTGANLEIDSGGDADPEVAAIDRRVLTAIFRELREHERRALWQWAVERRPLAEIAHDQGRSYKAVQQFLIRARRHALSVAARVAALLGLVQLGRVARRLTHLGQLALAAVAVPVVLASVPSSNTVDRHHAVPAPPPQSILVGRAPAPTANGFGGSARSMPVEAAPGLPVTGVPVSVPSGALEGATSTVDSATSTLKRSVERVTRVIESASGTRVDVPGMVGLLPK
jgi:RNA polymerase sigma factor (sigma-70 family)